MKKAKCQLSRVVSGNQKQKLVPHQIKCNESQSETTITSKHSNSSNLDSLPGLNHQSDFLQGEIIEENTNNSNMLTANHGIDQNNSVQVSDLQNLIDESIKKAFSGIFFF